MQVTDPKATRDKAGWRFWQLGVLAVLLAILLVARRPQALLQAQLWGDDGWYWYPDAYRSGIRCLLVPINGYLNSLQRLGGILVQPAPLLWVPALFVMLALAVQVAPLVFLASDRMATAWPNRRARLEFGLVVAVLPYSWEIYGNLTNAQWNLALLAFLVVASRPAASMTGFAFDLVVLLVSGLSGPFCLLLLPIAGWRMLDGPHLAGDWRAVAPRLAMLAATACIQLHFLLLKGAPHGSNLGATPGLLARILSLQVILGAELGFHRLMLLVALPIWHSRVFAPAICLLGLAVCIGGVLAGPRLLRQFGLFAAMVAVLALINPHVSPDMPQWQAMAQPLNGSRYFIFLMITWVGMLFALAACPAWYMRGPAVGLLAVLVLYGVPHDWGGIAWRQDDFNARARAFAVAPVGTRMMFPVIPTGLRPMILVKQP